MAPDRALLLTPAGAGAIAVVRLRGPGTAKFFEAHFSQPLAAHRCVHGLLRFGDEVIDDPVIVLIDEQTADVNLHGGPAVLRAFFDLVKRAGFAVTSDEVEMLDGEDLLRREWMQALSQAKTRLCLEALLPQRSFWTAELKEDAGAMAQDYSLWHLLHPPTVALIGVANVGKSTLANALFGQQRSIVFDQPGTTRDWVGDFTDLDGLILEVIDTPGQRPSTDQVEQAAIARSKFKIDTADLVLLVLDQTQPAEPQHALMARHAGALIIVNKIDLTARWQLDRPDAQRIVAKDGIGISALEARIRERFLGHRFDPAKPRWWTKRQRAALIRQFVNE